MPLARMEATIWARRAFRLHPSHSKAVHLHSLSAASGATATHRHRSASAAHCSARATAHDTAT